VKGFTSRSGIDLHAVNLDPAGEPLAAMAPDVPSHTFDLPANVIHVPGVDSRVV